MLKRVTTAILSVALLSIVAPGQSHAATTVSVTAENVTVRYADCEKTPVTAAGDWAEDVSNEIRFVVRGPSGRWFDARTVTDEFSGEVTRSFRFCGSDREGLYRVRVVATGFDEFGDETARAEDSTRLRYRHVEKAASRIKREVQFDGVGTYPYTVPGRLLRRGRGVAQERVRLEARISGFWIRIDRARTNGRGYVGWEFKPNPRLWRYTYSGNRTTRPSTSETFRTPRRGARSAPAGAVRVQQGDLKALVRSR